MCFEGRNIRERGWSVIFLEFFLYGNMGTLEYYFRNMGTLEFYIRNMGTLEFYSRNMGTLEYYRNMGILEIFLKILFCLVIFFYIVISG